ncbi:MAG: molybdopterin synthase catalytic subunit MoaE [Burkholderiaceae bacterium]
MAVSVRHEDFDLSTEVAALRAGDPAVGAVACFVGTVRDLGGAKAIDSMTLEHYPGMTERALREICDEAVRRWPLRGIRVVHRVGLLRAGDQIVLVAVASQHRGVAFEACEFVIDYLKTRAPFWKKERGAAGERWVDARDSDDEAARRWAQAQAQQQ